MAPAPPRGARPRPAGCAAAALEWAFASAAPVVADGWRRPLRGDDCHALAEGEGVEELLRRYDALSRGSGARGGRDVPNGAASAPSAPPPSTAPREEGYRRRMWQLAAGRLLGSGVLFAYYAASQLAQPLLIRGLVESVRDRTDAGAAYAAAVALAAVTGSVAKENALAANHAVGGRLRAVSTALVFRKWLRLSQVDAARVPHDVSNLMSSDAQKWLDLMPLVHLLWAAPAQIIAGAGMLVHLMGWEALAGVGVLLVAVPLNAILTRRLISARRAHLPATDARVRLTTESVHGMRVLKLNGLDEAFENKVRAARAREMPFVNTEAAVFAQQITATIVLPPVATLVAFAAYLLADSERQLLADTAWPVLSVFSVVRFPIMYLSDVLGQATQTWVSSGRLEAFLSTPDSVSSPLLLMEDGGGGGGGSGIGVADGGAGEGNGGAHGKGASGGDSCTGEGHDADGSARGMDESAANTGGGAADALVAAASDPVPVPVPRVVCRGTDFWWQQKDGFRVTGVDLKVAAGELLMVIGPVGSGKSTFINGLLGESERGASDGSSGPSIVTVSGSVALAAQTPWIQNGSLRENVLFGRPMRSGVYRAALSAACLWPDIAALPDADNTVIGERGVTLSGGQKQRVALARAAYARPDVLLLDDPLSALDAQTQRQVFERLIGPEGMCGNAATILSTHATSLLRFADRVLLLDQGRVAACGAPRELLEVHGGQDLARVPSVTAPLADLLATLSSDSEAIFTTSDGVALGRSLNKWMPPADDDLRLDEDRYADARQRSMAQRAKEAFGRDLFMAAANASDAKGDAGSRVSDDDETLGLGTALAWLRAAGGPSFCLLLFVFFLWERAAYIGGDVYLAVWTEDAATGRADAKSNLRWYCLIVLANVGGAYARTAWFIRGGVIAAKNLFDKLLHKVFRAPMALFETTPMGAVTNRLTFDVEVMDGVLLQKGLQAVASVFWWISGVGVMAATIPWILLALAPVMGLYYLLHSSYIRAGVQAQQLFASSRSPLQSHLGEIAVGAAHVRALRSVGRFNAEAFALIDYSTRTMLLWMILGRWLAVRVEMLGACVTFAVGIASWALRGSLSPSFAGLAITWAFNFSITLNFLVLSFSEMESKGVSMHRILQYTCLDEEPPRRGEDAKASRGDGWPLHGALTFEDVSLRYRPGLPLALRGLSVSIAAGEKVGVCGRTGSGKSTLAVALFRLTELASGRILVDGVDLRSVGLLGIRGRACAVIPQDPLLYSGTLRFNLDPLGEHEDHVLMDALDRVGMRRDVAARLLSASVGGGGALRVELGSGTRCDAGGILDTAVEGGGVNFSHGQRQLLCTARALLRGARIVVLDEATASCDAQTDALLQRVFRRAFERSTVLTVAHRMATIADCDKVMVLQEGTCVELGEPRKLLAKKNGAYRAMVDASGGQFGDGSAGAPASA
eukprot:PRCOL_00005193-RA